MRVFYDVDTQHDFMDEDGALYVPGAEAIKPALARLSSYAADNSIPLMGSVDVHFGTEGYRELEGELARWDGPFPDHCMAGTYGCAKISETQPPEGYISIPNIRDEHVRNDTLNAALQKFAQGSPVYFEKQAFDVTTNPAFGQFFEPAGIGEAVVYGVATDYCVRDAVLGMQHLGVQCYVVKEATSGIQDETVKEARDMMHEAGARFISIDDVLGSR